VPPQTSHVCGGTPLTRWGRLGSAEDRTRATQPARDAALAGFERQADPEGRLTPVERARAAECSAVRT
jgi:hypothetical protein